MSYLDKPNPKSVHADYIYPISYKIAKRQTLWNGFALIGKTKKGPGFIPDPFEYYLYSTTARIDITTRINVATAGINYVAATRINYITTGFRGFTIRSVGIS